jgi:hypothetical protein
MQQLYRVYCDLGVFLSLLVRTAGVCSGKVKLVHVSVCSTDKVSILTAVLQIHIITKALFVNHFKICLQYDIICWGLPPVRRCHRRFECFWV